MSNSDFVRLQLLQIECEMHGMIAENMQRQITGNSMVYTAEDFMELVSRLNNLGHYN